MASTTRTPVKRRTTASPKRATPKPPVEAVDGDFEVIELSSKPKSEDRVPLFSIDGEVYSIPRTVPQGVALEFLRISRMQGENVALQRLLERLLGSEAYEALEQSPDLDEDKMQRIADMAQKIAFGNAEVKEGKGD